MSRTLLSPSGILKEAVEAGSHLWRIRREKTAPLEEKRRSSPLLYTRKKHSNKNVVLRTSWSPSLAVPSPTSSPRHPFRGNFSTGPQQAPTQRAGRPAVITACKCHLGPPFNAVSVVVLQLVLPFISGTHTHLWRLGEGERWEGWKVVGEGGTSAHSFTRSFICKFPSSSPSPLFSLVYWFFFF